MAALLALASLAGPRFSSRNQVGDWLRQIDAVQQASISPSPASRARLGVEVVPLAMDDGGLRVDGVIAAHKRHRLNAIYVQPTLHNPLGMTMAVARRRELVAALHSFDLTAIEDQVYTFLVDDGLPPAFLAPGHVVMIDSLSKRVAPGLAALNSLARSRAPGGSTRRAVSCPGVTCAEASDRGSRA